MELTTLAIPALSFGAVATAAYALLGAGNRASWLANRVGRVTGKAGGVDGTQEKPSTADVDAALHLLREQKYSNIPLLDQMISRRSWAEREAAELTRADVPLRVGEFLLIRALLALVCFVIAFVVLRSAIFALPFALPGYFIPWLWIKHLQAKRRRQFDDQLVDALQLLGSTLKSGYSFLQGMEAVAREMTAPISEEFDLLVREVGVGAKADDALLRLMDRIRSQDLELVVTAIMIQRQVGGELAGILETIVKTVRERQKIMRDVGTLTAQQRWSGYIIGALPIFIMLAISFVNPAYVAELFTTSHGNMMLVAAFVMEVIGFFVIRRIIAIEV
jgi:tight adherence protein B